MKTRGLAVIVAAFAALTLLARAEGTAEQPPKPPAVRLSPEPQDNAALEARAQDIFDRLLRLSPIPGPEPRLLFSDDPVPKAKAVQARVTVSRRLLRLCASAASSPRGAHSRDARDALIAFVLAHELAHLARRDAGSFGSREASEAVEKDADEQAVKRLFFAGIELQPLTVDHLLLAIARETNLRRSIPAGARRVRGVRKALAAAQRSAGESHLGWLLTVAGRFDQAIAFHEAVASTYPYPEPMYALAIARLHAAWRTLPCDEPALLEWLPPVRLDPRAQVERFTIRSSEDACDPFRAELGTVAAELAQAPGHAPAQVTLAAVRLMVGESPTLDPTSAIGGVRRIGEPCPPMPIDTVEAGVQADACHVSLLSQYELSKREPNAREVAIEGLARLRERWPSDPSLQYNLARLLAVAGRDSEAVGLWREFLETAGPGPYRKAVEASVSRVDGDALDPVPQLSQDPLPTVSQLAVMPGNCGAAARWEQLPLPRSSSWKYCGRWTDEIVVKKGEETIIRSIALGSNAPLGIAPPSAGWLFATTNAAGEELRIWEEQAWLFRGKTPQRVVYFKKPR